MARDYWKDRQAQALTNLTNRGIKATEAQLKKYYKQTMERSIADFEATYDKLLATMEAGREPTPADLYKLDKYWQAQAQLKDELQKLGDKEAALFSKQFEDEYINVYEMLARDSGAHFGSISKQGAAQMIQQVWAADGKSWSSRIWENTADLAETLNEKLIECVVGGKKTSELKKALMERFNVSFSRADALARTELAHIQTQAARQRYEDTGIEYVEIWADPDERTCEVCGKLHKKRLPVGATMPIPAHPRCRCTIVPVVEIPDETAEETEQQQPQQTQPQQQEQQQPQRTAQTPTTEIAQPKVIPQVQTRQEAYASLENDIGFARVEASFDRISDEMAVEITNELNVLESRFKAVSRATTPSISGGARGNTEAYVSYMTTNPYMQDLCLNPAKLGDKETITAAIKGQMSRNYCMAVAEGKEHLQSVTHEYGHMLQDIMIGDEMTRRGWTPDDRYKFMDYSKKTRAAQLKWYNQVSKEVEDQCFKEIVEIAKKNNPDFSLSATISTYGASNKSEFFAEVFANSQLGAPNELGIAMEEWLKQKGY